MQRRSYILHYHLQGEGYHSWMLQTGCVYIDKSWQEPSSRPETVYFRHGFALFPMSKPTSNYSSFWVLLNKRSQPHHCFCLFLPSCSQWYVWMPNLMRVPSVCSSSSLDPDWNLPCSFMDKDVNANADTSLHGCRMEIKPGMVCKAYAHPCTVCLSFHWKHPYWNLKHLPSQMWSDWHLALCDVFRIQQKVQVF